MREWMVDFIIVATGQTLAIMVGYWLRGYMDKHKRDDWQRTLEREQHQRVRYAEGLEEQMTIWSEEDEWEVRGDER